MQRHEQQFRHEVESAGNALHEEALKLVPIETRLKTVEKQLQEQIVVDVFRGEKAHANMLANELIIIRKVSKLVADLKLIFETLIVRICTIRDYNEFYNAMSSTVRSLKEVKHGLTQLMPSAKAVFTDMSETRDMLVTFDIKHQPNIANITDDALEILEEASGVVEERLKHKFPTLPKTQQRAPITV